MKTDGALPIEGRLGANASLANVVATRLDQTSI
jgi:hypothetical protein